MRHLNAYLVGFMMIACLASDATAQEAAMQEGIHVQMAVSSHAATMPAADDADAWIVTVTSDGRLYFGTDPVTVESLKETMIAHPRKRWAELYVKADAQAAFDSVEKVLEAARESSLAEVVLLTSQPAVAGASGMVPPSGLEIEIGHHTGQNAVEVELSGQGQVRVGPGQVPAANLEEATRNALRDANATVVAVKASGMTTFESVVRVIDVSRGLGARVIVILPSE